MSLSMGGSKVLVLGGRGFLGRHLSEELTRAGASVRVFDRAGTAPAAIDEFSNEVEVIEGDFVEGRGLANALCGVDLVYHLISTTVPSGSNANPIEDVTSNLVGTLRLLDLMRCASVNRIVYASSGGTVYGNPQVLPVAESHPLRPISSYGVVKVAVENYLHLQSELNGLIANVLRISNPYGAYQKRIGAQGVVATFINKLRNDEPIEIWGDGSVVRDYVYATDVAKALLLAGWRSRSGIFNIGSGVGHSINDVLRIVRKETGLSGHVRYLPNRRFDVHRTYLNIDRARNELGWQPLYSLEEGCARYWESLRACERVTSIQ
jgi:UDP-glucose 4-epimerase